MSTESGHSKLSAAIPGIVYAFLGTSRQLNVAPEAALSLLLGQAVQQIRHDLGEEVPDGHDALGLAVASIVTLQVGDIHILLDESHTFSVRRG